MNKFKIISILLVLASLWACKNDNKTNSQEKTETVTLVFGSCAHEDKDQPMLNIATDIKKDAFIYLGDNIYGDTRSMDTLQIKYDKLASKPEFQKLKQSSPIFSVWDDHDFGENDAGRHYPFKAESKAIFMDFWGVSKDSDRRKHEGIYGVEYIKKGDLNVQVVMLDTRTFRDDLIHRAKTDTLNGHKNDYIPNVSQDSTFLGNAQWAWLESVLKTPADARIIASSNQFSHEYNGWESWTNVPHQQQKFIDLIKSTKAENVIFTSGDVHWGEISKMNIKDGYPIYDVTSSGITQTWDKIEPNKNRIGKALPQNNIGKIVINKTGDKIEFDLSLTDETAKEITSHKIDANELTFKK